MSYRHWPQTHRLDVPFLKPPEVADMRRFAPLFTLALTASIVGAPGHARAQSLPTADDIISRYVQRVGGAQRLRALVSVRRYGKFYGGGGFEAQIAYASKRPNMVREEFTFGGLTGFTAYDGKNGWKIEPWGGKKDVETLGDDEMKGLLEDAMFDDPLFDFAAKGNKVEVVGADLLEGTDVYKLKVTLAVNGDVRTYYIDADSYVPIKLEVTRTVRGAEREFEIEFGDYKAVQRLVPPLLLRRRPEGKPSSQKAQFQWDRIEANVALSDAMFAAPAAGVMPTPIPVPPAATASRVAAAEAHRRRSPPARPASIPPPPPDSARATSAPPR